MMVFKTRCPLHFNIPAARMPLCPVQHRTPGNPVCESNPTFLATLVCPHFPLENFLSSTDSIPSITVSSFPPQVIQSASV